jgi:hypothetical protein
MGLKRRRPSYELRPATIAVVTLIAQVSTSQIFPTPKFPSPNGQSVLPLLASSAIDISEPVSARETTVPIGRIRTGNGVPIPITLLGYCGILGLGDGILLQITLVVYPPSFMELKFGHTNVWFVCQ